jgi:uncharacterized SAM-binding protein YcdF (DUF218 family)
MFNRFARYARWCAYFALFAFIGGGAALLTAGYWLVPAPAPLRPADAIVVLAGGYERSLHAADLYHQGLAPRIWVSHPARERGPRWLEQFGIVLPREEEIHQRLLRFRKVAPAHVELFGTGSLSTAEEALALRRRAGANPQRLIIVTSPTHVRRASLIIGNALRGQHVELQVVATPYERFDALWWRDQASARAVVLELAKLVHYYLGGRYLSAAAAD